jgi:hypothetical protein
VCFLDSSRHYNHDKTPMKYSVVCDASSSSAECVLRRQLTVSTENIIAGLRWITLDYTHHQDQIYCAHEWLQRELASNKYSKRRHKGTFNWHIQVNLQGFNSSVVSCALGAFLLLESFETTSHMTWNKEASELVGIPQQKTENESCS